MAIIIWHCFDHGTDVLAVIGVPAQEKRVALWVHQIKHHVGRDVCNYVHHGTLAEDGLHVHSIQKRGPRIQHHLSEIITFAQPCLVQRRHFCDPQVPLHRHEPVVHLHGTCTTREVGHEVKCKRCTHS